MARVARSAPARKENEINFNRKLQWEYVGIDDVEPYAFNPRMNEKAVPAVAESIRNFGFLIPIVLDSNNVLVAGHTRVEAAKLLGMVEVPSVRADYLTPEQVNAFRLIDNKVAEQASWDFDLLAGEIGKLGDLGLDFTQFGWTQNEIDCLSEIVAEDCLDADTLLPEAERAAAGHGERRAPATARLVLGELVGFVPVQAYRNWIDGLRQLHDYDEEAMLADVYRRLGLHV
jgi:hypothetical protein